jgi:8-amino-7-oxononanoate synthase
MTAVAIKLEEIKSQQLYRELRTSENLLDFASNDYLGLSRSPEIKEALIREIQLGCPLGSTGSRLLTGQTKFHERVEAFLGDLFSAPSALLFSSGYLANLGVMVAFGSLDAEFFSDKLNHASFVDGIRLTKSKKSIFRHNDLNDLSEKLKSSTSKLKVIVTESVFSQDGDLIPLEHLINIANREGAWLIVDEAHATGVIGRRGLGCLEDFKFNKERVIAIHTGGKALGGQGAFVVSSQDVRNLLINRARSFIFNTALSPLSALQLEYALRIVIRNSLARREISELSKVFRNTLFGDDKNHTCESHIVPVVLGTNMRVIEMQRKLQSRGFDVRAIRSPTVPLGTERLRVTLKSFHQHQDVISLAKFLKEEVNHQ